MKKVLTIGGATQDIFLHYKNPEMITFYSQGGKRSFILLQEGRKIEVTNLDYATGGGGTNSAVSFARLGFETEIFCKVGRDDQGAAVLAQLRQEGVDTTYLLQAPDTPTGVSFIIPSQAGDRTIMAYRGANAHINAKDIPFDALSDLDQLYLTSLSGPSSQLLLPIVQRAKGHGISVAANPGRSQLMAGADMLQKSLKCIDILILNALEGQVFMASLVQTDETLRARLLAEQTKLELLEEGPELLKRPVMIHDIQCSLRQYFCEVLSRGPRIVVVTNGAEGVYLAAGDTMYFHPSISVEVKNTLGAGDAFGSCFVASLARGVDLQQSLINGIINATSVISFLNAKQGLLTWPELEKRAHEVGQSGLVSFPL